MAKRPVFRPLKTYGAIPEWVHRYERDGLAPEYGCGWFCTLDGSGYGHGDGHYGFDNGWTDGMGDGTGSSAYGWGCNGTGSGDGRLVVD